MSKTTPTSLDRCVSAFTVSVSSFVAAKLATSLYNPAPEMTYIVSGGALNSTQTQTNKLYNVSADKAAQPDGSFTS